MSWPGARWLQPGVASRSRVTAYPMPTLAAARAAAGLSQPALAALAGVSTSTITRIERGRTRPCSRVVDHLSVALGVRPETIIEFQPVALRTRLPEPSVRATGR